MELSTLYRPQRVASDLVVVLVVALGLGVLLSTMLVPNPWSQASWLSFTALVSGLVVPVGMSISVLRRTPRFLTLADRITLWRGILIGGCATLAVLVWGGAMPAQAWLPVLFAVPAMLLDAVDGWVARRTGTANDYGGRLDMETDAALLIILSIAAAFVIGPWVLLIGAMRYLFVTAGLWRPALQAKLVFSNFRRIVGGFQSIALVIALAPVTTTAVAVVTVAVALGLLLISFGKDVMTLERSFRRETMASASHSRSRSTSQQLLRIFWILLIISVAAEFIYEAMKKLLGDPVALAPFAEFGWPLWFAYVVAITELVASLMLFVPKTRRLGALLLIGVMVGATVTSIVNEHPDYIWLNVLLLVAAALLAVQRAIDHRLETSIAKTKTSTAES